MGKELSDEDKHYVAQFLQLGALDVPAKQRSLQQEIDFIVGVQRVVLERVSGQHGVEFGSTREPKDLFESQSGLCFDRSRVIEKILNSAGLRTRHIAIYSTVETGSALISLLTPQVPSHALTEVLTQAGWMAIDSNDP